MRRAAAVVIAAAFTLSLAACSSDSATETDDASGSNSVGTVPEVTGGFGEEPTIEQPQGDPPTEVIVEDLSVGDGTEAEAGATVTVDYHGVTWSTGEVFDSSFQRGEPATFPLDGLIPCWQDGIPGMREGGRRELVCTPDSAYGPAGGGNPLSGETLVFVVDLVAVG